MPEDTDPTRDLAPDEAAARTAPTPPKAIGPYRILEHIGEGGFGVVYLAEQTEPVRRRVALKLIKPGMDSKAVIARFSAERQALALMDHPNVAKVLDAGTTDRGLPYFVMEHVRGVPITEHCDRQRLTIDQRLTLFIDVCNAIQHAHHKGVIHRDIKPSNILVEYIDGRSIPKVIDFGVAKALHQPLTDATVFTQHGQLIGTPEYMSPEQAEMSHQDIDTRTDVYSLGVLLYELITGTLPFDQRALRAVALAEVHRIIREVEPPRPSTRLSHLPDSVATTLVEISRARHTDPHALTRTLRSDLDWIVMRALEKNRERRYDTANALALEIRRFLDDEPVLAGPPSAAYRFRKFAKRNRAPVTAAAVILLLLLGGIASLLVLQQWAIRERDRAESALVAEAERAAQLQQVADFQAAQLGAIDIDAMGHTFRAGLREELRDLDERRSVEAPDPTSSTAEFDVLVAGADFTGVMLNALDEHVYDPSLEAINDQFADQPIVRAYLLQALSCAMIDAGLFTGASVPQATALAIRCETLGENHPDTLESFRHSGYLLQIQGRHAEAEPLLLRAHEGCRSVLGSSHPQTLQAIDNYAFLLHHMGKIEEAERLKREAWEGRRRTLGEEHPDTLMSRSGLAWALMDLWHYAEAEEHYRKTLEARRRVLGKEHPDTLTTCMGMADFLMKQGMVGEAETLARETLDARRRVQGNEHPLTLSLAFQVGWILHQKGEFAEASRFVAESLHGRMRVLGLTHPTTIATLYRLCRILEAQKKHDEAISLLRDFLLDIDRPSATSRDILRSIGDILARIDDRSQAVESYRQAHEEGASAGLIGDVDTIDVLVRAGDHLRAIGRLDEAEEALREAASLAANHLGDPQPDHWLIHNTRSLLGECALARNDLAEAESLLLPAAEALLADDTAHADRRREAVARVVHLYRHTDRPDEAARWEAEIERLAPSEAP